MADLSFSFDYTEGSDALSKITSKSGIWDKASAASSAVIVNAASASDAKSKATAASAAASNALSKAGVASGAAADGSNALSKITSKSSRWDQGSDAISKIASKSGIWDKASAASSQVALAIKSTPASNSRAVHEIVITSAGEIKYIYSSNAAA